MVLFALLHYGVLLVLAGFIFLVQRIPPKAVNLDTLIGVLVKVENVLVAPRTLLLWLWPSETTPAGLGLAVKILNSVAWGMFLVVGKSFWQRATK